MTAYANLKYSIPLGNYAGSDSKHNSLYGNKEPDNPIFNIAPPLETGFLGTRVAHLMFITRLYSPWPPTGLQDALDRIVATFDRFPRFRVHVWVDLTLAAQIEADEPAPGYLADMTAMAVDVEQMCIDYAAYGFVYEGDPGGSVPTTRIDEIIADMLLLA